MFILSVILIILASILYIYEVRKTEFTTKKIVTIGMFSGIAFILSVIQFIQMPQGGSVSLLSMLPIMLVGLLYGRGAGMTAGLIFGILKLFNGAYVVHPIQLVLDYILGNMALGLAGSFGMEYKKNIILGCLMASMISVLSSVLSGVVFFAEFAGDANVWVYSFVYNFSSIGVEGILSTIVVAILPLKRIAREAKIAKEV